jgi:anti-anti-sigma factor
MLSVDKAASRTGGSHRRMSHAEEVEIALEGNTLTAAGHLGPDSIRAFSEAARQLALSPHESVVFDLAEVTYMSSSYLGVLSASVVEVQTRGGSALVKVRRQVRRLLQLAGIDQICAVHNVDVY